MSSHLYTPRHKRRGMCCLARRPRPTLTATCVPRLLIPPLARRAMRPPPSVTVKRAEIGYAAEMFPRVVLWIDALTYLGLGAWLAVDPATSLRGVNVGITAPPGQTELRAMYGGLELGLGAFLALAATRPAWREAGLWMAALSVGGLGTARGLSALLDASSPMLWGFVALELGATALNAAAIVAQRRADGR